MPRQSRVGQRVVIKTPRGGNPWREFEGQAGRIVGEERDGRTRMYRVRLDEPVNIPGVGLVHDDLWQSQYLKRCMDGFPTRRR